MQWIRQIIFLSNQQMLLDAGGTAHPWVVLKEIEPRIFQLMVGTSTLWWECAIQNHEVLPDQENGLTKITFFIPKVRQKSQNFLESVHGCYFRGVLSLSDHEACLRIRDSLLPNEPGGH
jgi:hypothetical protein